MFAGERSLLKDVLVPTLMDDLIVNKFPETLHVGIAVASSEYSCRDRPDEIKNYFANCTVYDSATGAMLMQLRGLHYSKLGVEEGPDPHTFDCVTWKPDITFLATQDQLSSLGSEPGTTKLDLVMDLIAHKRPTLKVLEINLDSSESSSLWFGTGDFSATCRWAYSQYDLASIDAMILINAQSQHGSRRDTSFFLTSLAKEGFRLSPGTPYGLAIIKAPKEIGIEAKALVRHLKPLLSDKAYIFLVRAKDSEGTSYMDDEQPTAESQPSSSAVTRPPSEASTSPAETASPPSSAPSEADEKELDFTTGNEDSSIWDPTELQSLAFLSIVGPNESPAVYLCGPEFGDATNERQLVIARLSSSSPALSVQSKL
jgi:hypothetical protein